MRFFFVAYCFSSPGSQALIGVYKRGLRVALELSRRGHEVLFFCTGREGYRDELTERAEREITFLDLPVEELSHDRARSQRDELRRELERLAPDQVVVGEAPLAGAMLEITLVAVALGIPVVFLDNAYHPGLTNRFAKYVFPMADGAVLTGPSSFYSRRRRTFLAQVPPYIELPPGGAASAAAELGLRGQRVLTVLAYDEKVESVGLDLFRRLAADDAILEAVFLSRRAAELEERLEELPADLRRRTRVLTPPRDPLLFSLLALSRLAVSKYGFMQVSECLALSTPVVAVYYEGHDWLRFLPRSTRRFSRKTAAWKADSGLLAAARRMLRLAPAEMARAHRGGLDAAARTGDFLETLPRRPREATRRQTRRLGFTEERLRAALYALEGTTPGDRSLGEISALRAMRLRKLRAFWMYALVCRYRWNGASRTAFLWGRRYRSFAAARRDLLAAADPASGRRPLWYSFWGRRLIELDVGQAMLPRVELEARERGRRAGEAA